MLLGASVSPFGELSLNTDFHGCLGGWSQKHRACDLEELSLLPRPTAASERGLFLTGFAMPACRSQGSGSGPQVRQASCWTRMCHPTGVTKNSGMKIQKWDQEQRLQLELGALGQGDMETVRAKMGSSGPNPPPCLAI